MGKLDFASIFRGALHSLIQQAEVELGGGKGAEKKAWVLDRLTELVKLQQWPAFVQNIVIGLGTVLIDFMVKAALAGLEKLD